MSSKKSACGPKKNRANAGTTTREERSDGTRADGTSRPSAETSEVRTEGSDGETNPAAAPRDPSGTSETADADPAAAAATSPEGNTTSENEGAALRPSSEEVPRASPAGDARAADAAREPARPVERETSPAAASETAETAPDPEREATSETVSEAATDAAPDLTPPSPAVASGAAETPPDPEREATGETVSETAPDATSDSTSPTPDAASSASVPLQKAPERDGGAGTPSASGEGPDDASGTNGTTSPRRGPDAANGVRAETRATARDTLAGAPEPVNTEDGFMETDPLTGTRVVPQDPEEPRLAAACAAAPKGAPPVDPGVRAALHALAYSILGDDIVKDFNLALRAGEVVCLYGPSGCGKTTILRLASGIIDPDKGKARIFANRLSYLFQEHRLLPWRTLMENVLLVCRDKGPETVRKIETILEELRLDPGDRNKYPHELSGGMRQRVALARALVNDPDLLLMDEPFSALDYELKLHLYDLVLERVRSGVSVIMVTHDRFEALKLADRIVLLEKKPARCRKIMRLTRPHAERDDAFIERHLKLPVWRSYAE